MAVVMTAGAQHCHQNDKTDPTEALQWLDPVHNGSQSDIATHWLNVILYVPLKMHIRSGGRYAVDDVIQDDWGQDDCLSQLHIRRVAGLFKGTGM